MEKKLVTQSTAELKEKAIRDETKRIEALELALTIHRDYLEALKLIAKEDYKNAIRD